MTRRSLRKRPTTPFTYGSISLRRSVSRRISAPGDCTQPELCSPGVGWR